MGTIYYCACLDCQALVDLDKYYLIPALCDVPPDTALHETSVAYNRHSVYLLAFLLKHPGHRLLLGNEDTLDAFAQDWYSTYRRDLTVYT